MRLVVLNYAFDAQIESPERLLQRYVSLSDWCRAVSRAGMQVRLVQAFTRDAVLREGDIEWVFCASSAPRPRWGRRLHARTADFAPDVVHVNGLDAPVQMWMLRQILPPPVAIVSQDHGGLPTRNPAKAIVRRTAMRAADACLFTSAQLAEPWIRDGYIDAATVHEVLAASASVRPVEREVARQITGISGSPALLWVARLHPNKDPLTVLEGFERVALQVPHATLTMIYQDAELLTAVQQRIAASGVLRERVRLVGAVAHDDLAAWYSAADMFVIGSAREVCGYAAIEACACGVVPVLTDIPAFRAITANGAIGRHWRPGDANDLADAVLASCVDLDRQRAQVLAHFAERLSWNVVGHRARAVYESAVAGRRSRDKTP